MRKVLIAYDGSEPAKRALGYVINFARDHAAALHVYLLNVQQEPMLYGEYVTGEVVTQLQKSMTEAALQELEWPADQLKAAGLAYTTYTALGNVAEQVAALVQQQGCDTVVMGTRGLGSFTGMLLGSVATRVIHEVSVPVLLVK